MKRKSGVHRSKDMSRLRATAALAVMAAVLVPVAIAWACNPQANLKVDKPSYGPGERIAVSGAFFKPNAEITVTVEPNGAAVTVTTAGNGFFATSLTAPSTPGSYTVSAIGYESDGSVTPGLPARTSFTVSPAATPAPQGGSPTGQQPSAGQPGATRPGTTAPGANAPSAGRFAEPKVPGAAPFRSPGRAQSPTTGGRAGAPDRAAVVNTGAGVIRTPGTGAVFAGSVARAGRVEAVGSPAKAGKGRGRGAASAKAATPSQRSALSDVWSGLGSDNAPSLLPKAADAAPSGGGPGLQLIWGLALIGISLLALAAGLTTAEARRRKARAG